MTEAEAKRLKDAEDTVSLFINGGSSTVWTHPPADELTILVMLKQLRIQRPYQSTLAHDLDVAIQRAVKGTAE